MSIHIATLSDAPALAALATAFRNHLERDAPTGYVLQRYRHSKRWNGRQVFYWMALRQGG